MLKEIIFFSLLSYLYGALPYSYVATYLIKRKNLAEEGTGNVGVTNAFKVGGNAVGIITVLGELSKALFPIFIAHRFFPGNLNLTLLFVYCALIGTSFSIFLRGKGSKATTVGLWSLLILSPYALLTLLLLEGFALKIADNNFLIKKIPFLLIPLVIFVFEQNLIFTLFGFLTSILFFLNSFNRKDDFKHYGIFQK
jgi:acyl-phosphate glycerol 3-phosphate acyltransferase